MLYIIGGAARSGKTKIARRILDEHNIPIFCLDYFVSAMDRGAPELGIGAEDYVISKSEALWPRIEPLLRNIVEVEPHYLLEGDSIWPQGVAKLRDEYHPQIRTAYLGFADINPQQKLAEIRQFSGGINDKWIQSQTDDYILDLCTEMIEWSQFLRVECKRVGLCYFEVSKNFTEVLEQAYKWLYKPPQI